MQSFRNFTPKRRNITAVVNSYRDHKPELRIDFKERCGYCNSPDKWKLTYYESDHFIPEFILTIKANTDYSNLVYSCRSCNNAKRKKWPTGKEDVPNENDRGWVDPCDDAYNSHFSRLPNGVIKAETELGRWMFYNLKLHKPQHEIIYKLEEYELLIREIEEIQEKTPDTTTGKLLLNTYKNYCELIQAYLKLK